jgi:hypothetical protein
MEMGTGGSTCISSYSRGTVWEDRVWSQPGQIDCKALSWNNLSQKRVTGVGQGAGPEFKFQYYKTNKIQHGTGIKTYMKTSETE